MAQLSSMCVCLSLY